MKKRDFRTAAALLAALAVLVCFLSGITEISAGHREEGKAQLEQAIRRTAAACYASEGVYPPDLSYMREHYGLRVDETRYAVIYEVQASNLMPDITVLEIDHEE